MPKNEDHCYVYIVQCRDGMYYTGITNDLRRRIAEHNSGVKTAIQLSRRPVTLVYWKVFSTREEAAKREKEIKGWRRDKKELLISSLR
jgi:putative endonuclease